jgi:hypothetical protein
MAPMNNAAEQRLGQVQLIRVVVARVKESGTELADSTLKPVLWQIRNTA